MANEFAGYLKATMKKYKITGQQIADMVGVAQKTISRYARGESTADIVRQEEIKKALELLIKDKKEAEERKKRRELIKALGGTPGVLQDIIAINKKLGRGDDWDDDWDDEWYDRQEIEQEERERERDIDEACAVFALLEEDKQAFILKHLEAYCNIKNSEHEVVRRFYLVPRNKQKIILQTLENNVSLNNRDIVKNVRLFECTEMMYEMRGKWKTWVPCEFIPADANMNYKKTELVKKFGEALKEPGTSPARLRDNLYEYIAYEEADWYLILLVRMMSIGDKPSGLYIKRMTSKGEKPSRMYPEEECIMNKTLMLLDYLDWGWGKDFIWKQTDVYIEKALRWLDIKLRDQTGCINFKIKERMKTDSYGWGKYKTYYCISVENYPGRSEPCDKNLVVAVNEKREFDDKESFIWEE
jgi:transcriptional regulator with XRE-family HTH domain